MALVPIKLTRKFRFNGMELTDPDSQMKLEDVKSFYANQFPELLNSVIEGPVTKGTVSTYTFVKAVGDKGGKKRQVTPVVRALQEIASGAALKSSVFEGCHAKTIKENSQCSNLVQAVVNSRRLSNPMPLPQAAFGIWG